MPFLDTLDITPPLFAAALLILLVIAPLVSLGVLRLFQSRKKSGFMLMGTGVAVYAVFQLIWSAVHL